jgi:hypothetical protein
MPAWVSASLIAPLTRIRLGWVDPDSFAKMAGGFVGIVLGGQNNTQIEVCRPQVRIQRQSTPKVRFGCLIPVRVHFRVSKKARAWVCSG